VLGLHNNQILVINAANGHIKHGFRRVKRWVAVEYIVRPRGSRHALSLMLVVNLIFSALLTAFGSLGLIRNLRDLLRAFASSKWPRGEAVVIAAAIHTRRGPRGRTVFEPTVAYRYDFQHTEYSGHQIAFGDVTSDRDGAQRVIDRFAVGTKWEVAICDRKPEMAVLHAGPTHNLWFGVAFFAVYSVAALAFLVNSIGAVLVWARS
jgi:Protein of unknown function (DUF3592)